MTSPVVNVVRYTALASGIGYGVLHRRTLQAREDKRAESAAKKRLERELAEQTRRQEQQALQLLRGGGAGGADSAALDPESPSFDLEKLFASLEKSA